MDYAQQQRNPAKHLVGIAVVILLHIALVYALVNGLARKVIARRLQCVTNVTNGQKI